VLATGLLGLAFVALLALGWGAASAAPTPSAAQYEYTTFLGDWVSSEPDGSALTLKVSRAGSSVNVTITDSIEDGICAGEAMTAKGTATISGGTLNATVFAKCKRTKGTFGPFGYAFVTTGDGTLQGLGVVWTRP
jgi:hypothetical protein